MSREIRVRDPVHNFVLLRECEAKAAGTTLFQRLRGIRQLAMAHLVYPGALHTRFDHSLGVCHVAGLLADQLGLSPHEIELVRLAALLHDVGHGPFSHVSEHALDWYADRESLSKDRKTEKIHELITAHLIEHDHDLQRILGRDRCEKIAKLLDRGYGQPVLRAIVSGPLDADKQDYLLRDSHFCGVAYGLFDIHQFHRSLVLNGPDEEKELMIDPDGIHAVEQYVLAKYYLTTNVYRHRVRLITDQMIIRAIRLGIDVDGLDELRSLYTFDGSDRFYQNYLRWDDAAFLAAFGNEGSRGDFCRELLLRLRFRRLLKRVFANPLREFGHAETRAILQRIGDRENDETRYQLEQAISDELPRVNGQPAEARFVIVHAYTIRSVRVSSRNDGAGMLVARGSAPRPFEQESALFASIDEGYNDGYVEVYAPIDWDSETEKRRVRRELEKPIREIMEALPDRNAEGRQQ